jgi:Ca2+-binding EF-hand superfamily protein
MIKVISTAAAVALAVGGTWAAAQDAPAGEERGHRRGGRDAAGFIERYDTNKDGKLDQQELEAAHAAREAEMKARMLERFDANKNGVMDPEEKEAARQAFRGGRHGRGGDHEARLLERFDANKNGVLDPEEKAAAKAEFVKRFDTNGDGQIDDNERAAARKQFRGRGPRGEGAPDQD